MAVLKRISRPETDKLLSSNLGLEPEKPYRLTPYIVTFREGTLTDFDIQAFLEAGLRIIRFQITHIAKSDTLVLLSYLKKAITSCCERHEDSSWPVAISIDLPNACILTGYLKDESQSYIYLRQNSIVELTCEQQFWNKCDEKKIFIDDPFTFPSLVPGTEISINLGTIVLICTEVISEAAVKCRVDVGGELGNAYFVCIRGIRHKRPPLSALDIRLLEFVKENRLDIITIHSLRNPATVAKVRKYFKGCDVQPLIMCSICEQEGLEQIDSIIEVVDALILAREFLALALTNPNKLTAIQMYVSAKCRQHNKPFYISGNILENTLKHGIMTGNEISDVQNAIMQGAGFLLRRYSSSSTALSSMEMLNTLCQTVEPICLKDDFWPLIAQSKPPMNAADAMILACAVTVKQTATNIVIVLTVTGRTAMQLTRLTPCSLVLAVTTNPSAARQMQLYRGIVPIVYRKVGIEDWYEDMSARIDYAVQFGLKKEILSSNQTYVVFRRASSFSAFCDEIGIWNIVSEYSQRKWLTLIVKKMHP